MKKLLFALSLFISMHTFAQEIVSNNADINAAFKLTVQTVDINTRGAFWLPVKTSLTANQF
jgi:hypothetical protein